MFPFPTPPPVLAALSAPLLPLADDGYPSEQERQEQCIGQFYSPKRTFRVEYFGATQTWLVSTKDRGVRPRIWFHRPDEYESRGPGAITFSPDEQYFVWHLPMGSYLEELVLFRRVKGIEYRPVVNLETAVINCYRAGNCTSRQALAASLPSDFGGSYSYCLGWNRSSRRVHLRLVIDGRPRGNTEWTGWYDVSTGRLISDRRDRKRKTH